MDQIRIGKFLAALRKNAGLTQEALGQRLGVTNKTISRWENGNYMPDIEMLQLLSREFDVSINELLAGERLADEAFRRKANENSVAAVRESTFTFSERKTFFIKKWRRDHISLLFLLVLVPFIFAVVAIAAHRPLLIFLAPIIALVEYGRQNNQMMIYVENSLYGSEDK